MLSSIVAVSTYFPISSTRVFPFLHTSPALVVYGFFDDHSDQYEVISHCILTCISLIMSDIEHIFMYLLVFSFPSLEKCLFRPFAQLLIGRFVFLVLSCISCLYILEINPLSVVSYAIIFSHSEGCLFTFLIVYFAVQKLVHLIRSHLFTFVFMSITLGGGS